MPPVLPKESWVSFRGPEGQRNEAPRGWTMQSLEVGDYIEKWKEYAMMGKKVIVVGGVHPAPLSQNVLTQIMQQGDEAWEGMSHRTIYMYYAFEYFMGGPKGAKLRQFFSVDDAGTSHEGAKCPDTTSQVCQTSSDGFSKNAHAITTHPYFQHTDILVINYDFSCMITGDTTFDDFTDDIIGRVDRAIATTTALIKSAATRIRKGGRIIVLVNSLWHLAITEASYKTPPVVAKHRALTEGLAQEVMEEQGIQVFFLMNTIVPDTRPIDWNSLRDTMNYYAIRGYSVDMLRKVGSRVAAIACKDSEKEQDEAAIYDRILAEALHTPRNWDAVQGPRREYTRQVETINGCLLARYRAENPYHPPNSMLAKFGAVVLDGRLDTMLKYAEQPPTFGVETKFRQRCRLSPREYDFTKTWLVSTVREKPLAGRVALVLDSGLLDGVTGEVCLNLTFLGAKVALTYVDEGENLAKANELVGMMRGAGGQAVALEGKPYRSEVYTDKEGEQEKYVKDLVFQTLRAFHSKQLHIIVNNVGYNDGLLMRNLSERNEYRFSGGFFALNLCERKKLVYADSIRNMLALHYVVEVCAGFGLLAHSARVINIAGIGTAPATAVDGHPFWDHHRSFMDYWEEQINEDGRLPEERVTFNTIVPYEVKSVSANPKYKAWEGKLWIQEVDRYFEKYRSPEKAKETARVVGWLARPTSLVRNMMTVPDRLGYWS